MKQINEKELKIIIVISKEGDNPPEIKAGAKYRVEADDLSVVRQVEIIPEGQVKTNILNFAKTVVTLIKQKEGI